MSSDTKDQCATRCFCIQEDVHILTRLFPQAFCKIVRITLTQDEEYCLIMHADGAGTKSSLYMYKETGDISVWKVAKMH
jgi:phosphoribosylformylglycinamidine cyclo-ligase